MDWELGRGLAVLALLRWEKAARLKSSRAHVIAAASEKNLKINFTNFANFASPDHCKLNKLILN